MGLSDPYVVRRGLRLALTGRPVWRLVTGGSFVVAPDLGEADLNATARQLIDSSVNPDISRALWRLVPFVGVDVVRLEDGAWITSLTASASLGAVGTRDDDLGLPQDDLFYAYEKQVHVEWGLGVSAHARRGRWGVRTRLERQSYVEIIDGRSNPKNLLWIGAAVTLTPGSAPED